MHQKNLISTILFKKGNAEQKRKEKPDDLECSPGSDIESQDLFNNVLSGHAQSRLIILTYFARSNIQMRYTDPTT